MRGASEGAGAIVLGGDYRGLGVARSLGRHGIPVWVVTDHHRVAAFSRYCQRSIPWPQGGDIERVRFLLDLAVRYGLLDWMLFPTSDGVASLVARHHADLAMKFFLTTQSWEQFRLAYDKRLIYSTAAELGIDQPWTFCPNNIHDVESLDCPFPAILKPAVKEGSFNAFTHSKAWRVDSKAELVSRYREAAQMVDPEVIMVQELIPGIGADYAYAALTWEGEPLASVVVWRGRQYPIEFGRASSWVETIDLPEVEEPARRLLAHLRFTGIIHVGFIRDPRDGRYKLLDLNPRVWGSHTIGWRAGVDFAYLLWRQVRGEPVSGGRGLTGVKWIRMLTDIPTSIRLFRRGLLSPRDYLVSMRGPREFAIFALDDPVPALVDAPLLALMAMRRGAA